MEIKLLYCKCKTA